MLTLRCTLPPTAQERRDELKAVLESKETEAAEAKEAMDAAAEVYKEAKTKLLEMKRLRQPPHKVSVCHLPVTTHAVYNHSPTPWSSAAPIGDTQIFKQQKAVKDLQTGLAPYKAA